jgi:hypothetical protein
MSERFKLLASKGGRLGRYAGSGPLAMAAAEVRAIAWFASLGPIRS